MTPRSAAGKGDRLQSLADRALQLETAYDPGAAYALEVKGYDHSRWRDRSPAALVLYRRAQDELLAEVRRVKRTGLSPGNAALRAQLLESLEASGATRVCRLELWHAINHMTGWHLQLPQTARQQAVGSTAERQQALRRWSALPQLVEQEITNANSGLSQGYSAPKTVVRKVVKQLDGLLAGPLEKSPLWSPAERSDDPAFRAAYDQVLQGPVRQALVRYRNYLLSDYLPGARDVLGLSAHPRGKACYAAMLRSYTTLPSTPDQVFQLGRQTVEANAAVASSLGRTLFGTTDIGEIANRTSAAPSNRFASEQELINYSAAVVRRSRQLSEPLFASLPTQELRVEPFPAFRRGSGGSSYYSGDPDPKKPAYYRINSENWRTETKGGAEITAVHEGYPGHHIQMAPSPGAQAPHSLTRLLGNAAFIEGWARYSEMLAEESGMYDSVYARVTRRLWPARGMVADPGLHVFGWSRAHLVEYLAVAGRISPAEADDYADRIAMLPGQLTAYDSGGLEILRLREQARRDLGASFDLPAFHQVVLASGAVPLPLLRDNVQAYIERGAQARPIR